MFSEDLDSVSKDIRIQYTQNKLTKNLLNSKYACQAY